MKFGQIKWTKSLRAGELHRAAIILNAAGYFIIPDPSTVAGKLKLNERLNSSPDIRKDKKGGRTSAARYKARYVG